MLAQVRLRTWQLAHGWRACPGCGAMIRGAREILPGLPPSRTSSNAGGEEARRHFRYETAASRRRANGGKRGQGARGYGNGGLAPIPGDRRSRLPPFGANDARGRAGNATANGGKGQGKRRGIRQRRTAPLPGNLKAGHFPCFQRERRAEGRAGTATANGGRARTAGHGIRQRRTAPPRRPQTARSRSQLRRKRRAEGRKGNGDGERRQRAKGKGKGYGNGGAPLPATADGAAPLPLRRNDAPRAERERRRRTAAGARASDTARRRPGDHGGWRSRRSGFQPTRPRTSTGPVSG